MPAARLVQKQRSLSVDHQLFSSMEICAETPMFRVLQTGVGGGGHAAEGKKKNREALRK